MINEWIDPPDSVVFTDDEVGALENATLQESRHRLLNNTTLLWEAIGPDALPKDETAASNLEAAIASALVEEDYELLGRLVTGLALTYVYEITRDEIYDDWERYVNEY
jgi:hypothetical protein